LNYDVFGAVTGALGLFGILQMLYVIILSQLPSCWQKSLDDILNETESLWREALEEGLFVGSGYVEATGIKLSAFRHEVSDLRAETHCATSSMQQFRAMLCGLSLRICLAYRRIKISRAEISSTTAQERRRLLSEGR
ncbi:hypothetical protein B0H21DRAFT_669935, partial [Amylocystis lapponica]